MERQVKLSTIVLFIVHHNSPGSAVCIWAQPASCGLKSIIIGIIIHVHVRLCSHTASVSHVSHLPTTLVVHPFDPLICLTEFFLARHVHELSFLMGVYNIRNHLCSHAAPVGLIFAAFSKKMSGILMFNFFRFPPVAVVKPLTQSPAAISVCVLQTDLPSPVCLPSIKSHHAPHVLESERFGVEICCCSTALDLSAGPANL